MYPPQIAMVPISWYAFVEASAAHRALISSCVYFLFTVGAAWIYYLGPKGERATMAQRFVAVVFSINAAVMMVFILSIPFDEVIHNYLLNQIAAIRVQFLNTIVIDILVSIGIVGMIYERAYNQNQLSHKKMQMVLNEQQQFIRMFSHEYRTPLSIINSGLGLLKKEVDPAQNRIHDRLERMQRATGRLKRLVELYLDWDPVTDGLEEPAPPAGPARCDLSSCMSECISMQKSANPGREIRVQGVLDYQPAISEIDLLCCLDNLVGNALKFTPDHQEPIRLEVERGDDGQLLLTVSDRGIGMEPAWIGRIFDKYYRAPNAEDVSGTGMGLYLINRLMGKYAGEIRVQSRLHEGSAFTLVLPLADQRAQPGQGG
uniref:histidine kinase n=1 Tax=Magnetococcus massalia (strain MO-1) TaxID=451514 RepID=A0A1S7LCR3_MAGMO|nr:Putative histidine kinase with HATPase_c domain and HisKA domain [Candidatus Magnetococcus massalia]